MIRLGLFWLLCGAGAFALNAAQTGSGKAPPGGLADFSFVVGTWSGMFHLYPNARLPQETSAPATMTADWGPQHAWIESEASTEIPGMGQYVAKIVVGYNAQTQAFDAFVVNTFGGSARYAGKLEMNRVLFLGSIGPVLQRVTYEKVGEKELRFVVEDSRDNGKSFHPHSEILWKRR